MLYFWKKEFSFFMKKILFLYILTSLVSCEPDDICSENTQTTPRLVIEFFDIENFEAPKTVPGLFAVGLDDLGNEVTILGEVVNSRSIIELPLNGSENQTQFKLYSNYDIIDNEVEGNPDVITIAYETESFYVSRACGYKNNYSIQGFSIEQDIDLWMISTEITINEVTNENESHFKIFHYYTLFNFGFWSYICPK